MSLNFSPEYKTILENSRKEALRHYNYEIRPEHLLLALLEHTESKAFQLIKTVLNSDSVLELRQELDNSIFEQKPIEYNPDSIIANSLTERIIKLSALEARMLQSDIIDVEHLLLALFHNSEVQNMTFMLFVCS